MNIEKTFGEELQKIRKEKGLSQEQLGGTQINLTSPVIENCFRCCCEMESETVEVVCPFCGEVNICCHACEEWIEERTENCYRCVNGSCFVEGGH
ncbi:MAG: hypothetical protein H8E17_03910 [Deltaproteobacteria bacterium]|nr:hypothetical protein [Deltaproteobacteria bacterium]MBI9019819.1 hypothetical protein [Verrucomicrobiota bacterium]